MQRTIGGPATIEGVGLHTGEKGIMRFLPAPVGHGVRFVRTDLAGQPEVQVRPENAHFDPGAGRRTILQQDGVQIHTMEHVLAAVAGLGIDKIHPIGILGGAHIATTIAEVLVHGSNHGGVAAHVDERRRTDRERRDVVVGDHLVVAAEPFDELHVRR